MFSVAWQYLTGVSRAARFSDQSRPEWPPHPDRVFQALVASWAARGCCEAEREALCWLESLDPPAVCGSDAVSLGSTPALYVPSNGIEVPRSRQNQGQYVDSYVGIIPEKRQHRIRHNAQTWVGDLVCALTWKQESETEFARHQTSLSALCGGVTRIGRSSSFVSCWISQDSFPVLFLPATQYAEHMRWFRVSNQGRLQRLEEAYENGRRPARAVEIPYQRANSTDAPLRPDSLHNPLSPTPVIMRIISDDTIPLSATLSITHALRGRLISAASRHEPHVLPLVSGHAYDGSPLSAPHIAYVPMPFVGDSYGNGRILAVALFLPSSMETEEEDRLYHLLATLMDDNGFLTLTPPACGTIKLDSRLGDVVPKTLQAHSWSRSSNHWASVTPVVMDRMQNRNRSNPDAWAATEVGRMLTSSGFPQPESITVSPSSRHRGGLAVFDAPPIVRKDHRVRRMVHVDVRFSSPVPGPMLLGSGRYRGYGLCKPMYHRSNVW